jgi:hypothetical protein
MTAMSEPTPAQRVDLAREQLKAPRSAAIAGIAFALLYGSAMTLVALAIGGADNVAAGTWLDTNSNNLSIAMLMIPYAGIAFLWFIGVIRDQLGDAEDRLFSTVFLGSGLLFMALTFIASAQVSGLLTSYALLSSTLIESGVFLYARSVVYQVLNLYAIRMAGVFMITLGTIWLRTGVMRRALAVLTYVLALVLLLSIGLSIWVVLIFPAWVLLVSVIVLVRSFNSGSKGVPVEAGAG